MSQAKKKWKKEKEIAIWKQFGCYSIDLLREFENLCHLSVSVVIVAVRVRMLLCRIPLRICTTIVPFVFSFYGFRAFVSIDCEQLKVAKKKSNPLLCAVFVSLWTDRMCYVLKMAMIWQKRSTFFEIVQDSQRIRNVTFSDRLKSISIVSAAAQMFYDSFNNMLLEVEKKTIIKILFIRFYRQWKIAFNAPLKRNACAHALVTLFQARGVEKKCINFYRKHKIESYCFCLESYR